MKSYTVYFIIKKNNHGYLNQHTVDANNQKEAIRITRESVMTNTGRNAFNCTCKAPRRTQNGMEFNGMVYTRYNEFLHTLR